MKVHTLCFSLTNVGSNCTKHLLQIIPITLECDSNEITINTNTFFSATLFTTRIYLVPFKRTWWLSIICRPISKILINVYVFCILQSFGFLDHFTYVSKCAFLCIVLVCSVFFFCPVIFIFIWLTSYNFSL